MIKTIIIDDEQPAIDVIAFFLQQTPILSHVGSFTNPMEALPLVLSGAIDLVFLDIQMPQISGLDFVKSIGGKAKVILTTAYSEFAVDGFELDVIDYLVKPIALPRFLKATERAQRLLTETAISDIDFENEFILVKTEHKGKLIKIMLSDIAFIEGMKNYVRIMHSQQKTIALLNLKDLEERLPSKYFMRIHKSFIVALNTITMIDGDEVSLNGYTDKLYVSDTYRKQLLDIFKHKMM